MASDITLAVGDGARRMTYAELAAVRGTLQPSAERLARRRGWPRQVGNDGVARVLVPLAEARYVSKPAASGVAPATAVLAPDKRELAPVTSEGPPSAGPGQSPGQVAPDDRGHVRGLEDAFEALRDQLGVANDSLISERRRGDELQALLTEERRRAETTAPNTRGIIKEVIREIAGAAPPDDRDDDRERLQTLESAITALREQVEYAQSRLIAERQRAERVERQLEIERQSARGRTHALQASLTEERRRIDGLHLDLADARTAAVITGCEAAALGAQAEERRDSRLLRRLRWALNWGRRQ